MSNQEQTEFALGMAEASDFASAHPNRRALNAAVDLIIERGPGTSEPVDFNDALARAAYIGMDNRAYAAAREQDWDAGTAPEDAVREAYRLTVHATIMEG